jgi:phenylpyruvate tautomerase PptA (4-oxalocrotonate tautomerase family)
MPLWLIYHPVGTFEDDASQQSLAQDITNFYTTNLGLPQFYVVVNFIKLAPNNVWVGAKSHEKPFIRITINHVAVHMPDSDEVHHRTTAAFDELLKPHIAEKGYDWEYHVDETDRRLWKVNGLIPPPHQSDSEKLWAKENRPVPWVGDH